MSEEVTLTVAVPAPAEVAWAVASDWANQGEWMLGTEVHRTGGDGQSTGSTMVAFTGVAGLGFFDTMEITGWDPPRSCQVRHTGKLLRGDGGFRIEPTSDRLSRLVWWERLDLPYGPLGKVGWPLVRPAFTWGLRRSLDRFARLCRDRRP
ncbi:SRPBCC family protein [Crossiella sp. SN42]|uniref:SRPBCC family protein n=1 Tax=Crossiella sp. SN42 TaxID=2944808 RepID=UPI00207D48F7|nr:SRPBCC family protein [Crossiella sp. SN42]MCO1576972.1 SRPBCC family protein [Crossiella sp. SN42]